jgi:thiol:disulfide interchange protein DsbG
MKPISSILLSTILAAGLLLCQPAKAQQHNDPADMRAAAQVLQHLGAATSIDEGQGKRQVTVFFDPNCPYCRQLYSDLRPWVGKDDLQFRWVAVAILAPSSLGKAAAILQAKDPLQAFRAMEDHGLDPSLPEPAPPNAGQITARTRRTLKINDAVLKRAGAYYSVPLVVFRNRQGRPQLLLGAPRSERALAEVLQSVGH